MSYPQILPLFSPFKAMLHFFKFDVHWCLPHLWLELLDWFYLLTDSASYNHLQKTPLALTLHWGIYTLHLLTHFPTLNSEVGFTLSSKNYRTGKLGWLRRRLSGKENWVTSLASSQIHVTGISRVLSYVQSGGPAAYISCCSIFLFLPFCNKWNSEHSRMCISHMAVRRTLKLKYRNGISW